MPYNEKIEERIDALSRRWRGMEKKKMFGGICYLLNGNMCFGIYRDYLIVRLGAGADKDMAGTKHVRPFDITGRPMKGWVMVAEGGWRKEGDLKAWLERGRAFVRTLPPK